VDVFPYFSKWKCSVTMSWLSLFLAFSFRGSRSDSLFDKIKLENKVFEKCLE
jgi:hypothetical protein